MQRPKKDFPEKKNLLFSSERFNKYRDGAILLARDKSFSNRDFHEFNLGHARYFKCTFENCDFGPLEWVEFIDCRFIDCNFSDETFGQKKYFESQGSASFSINKVLFFKCYFEKFDLTKAQISDIKIEDCHFKDPIRAMGSVLTGKLEVINSGELINFLPVVDIQLRRGEHSTILIDNLKKSLVGWHLIRWIQKLSLAKLSVLGLALIWIQSLALNATMSSIESNGAICLGPKYISIICFQIGSFFEIAIYNQAMVKGVLVLTSLLIAHVLQLIFCPDEIIEYTKNNWIDSGRSDVQYDILNIRNISIFYLCSVFYGVPTIVILIDLAVYIRGTIVYLM